MTSRRLLGTRGRPESGLVGVSVGVWAGTGVAAGTGHLPWPAATLLSAAAAAPHVLLRTLRDEDEDEDG
jgi:hypothetical protein